MGRFKVSRRAVLRGAAGLAVPLPLLEIMLDSSKTLAQTAPPNRYVLCFDGQSLGADNDPLHNDYVPNTLGFGYDLKTALAPLAGFNSVQNEISVVSGLKIPTAFDNGGTV